MPTANEQVSRSQNGFIGELGSILPKKVGIVQGACLDDTTSEVVFRAQQMSLPPLVVRAVVHIQERLVNQVDELVSHFGKLSNHASHVRVLEQIGCQGL